MKNIFLLDMDDTLLDFQRAERVNLKKTLSAVQVEAKEALICRFHEINDMLWKALERGEIGRERLKVKRFELLFEEYGILCDPKAAAKIYWENFPFVCFPFDGACSFLKELSHRGRVYIVTNGGSAIQKRHIADAGFLPYLSGVFISEETGFYKPTKEFAEFVETHIENYEREHAVWIGDSLTSDGKCAETAGIDFILFSPHGAPQEYSGVSAESFEKILTMLFCEKTA